MTFCDIHASPTCMVLSQFHALMRFKDHTRITLQRFFFYFLLLFPVHSWTLHISFTNLLVLSLLFWSLSCTLCMWGDKTILENCNTSFNHQNPAFNILSFMLSWLLSQPGGLYGSFMGTRILDLLKHEAYFQTCEFRVMCEISQFISACLKRSGHS